MVTKSCPCVRSGNPANLTIDEIKDEIVQLIYKVKKDGNTDKELIKSFKKHGELLPELLTMQIYHKKKGMFDFLTGYTKFPTVGRWKGTPDEKNVQLDVEFTDLHTENLNDPCNEAIGKRLMDLLNAYNALAVGEHELYARTVQIEEGLLGKDKLLPDFKPPKKHTSAARKKS